MNNLQMVAIKARDDEFDIVEISTGFVVRGSIGRYDVAVEIAERIDARLVYEAANGDDSLQTI